MLPNAAMGSGWIAASVPPARRRRRRGRCGSSRWRSRWPGARRAGGRPACARPARARITARPTSADGPFGISMGTVCGETRRTPFSLSTSYWSSRVVTPPMPEAMTAPSRSGSTPAPRPRSLAALPVETGVLPGLLRGDQRELGRTVQSAGLGPRDDLGGVHGDRCGDADGLVGGPLLSRGLTPDLPATRPSRGRGCVATQRCGCADTGDDHGAIGRAHGNSFSNGIRIRTAPPPGAGQSAQRQ